MKNYHVFKPGDKTIPSGWLKNVNEVVNRNGNSPDSLKNQKPGSIVLVKNDSAVDLDIDGVLGIDDSIIDPATATESFRTTIVLSGVTPTSAHVGNGKFVVLRQPIPSGEIGEAFVSGHFATKINVSNADHAFADASASGNATLYSAATGPVAILWKETGTGVKNAVVRVDKSGGAQTITIYCATSEIIPPYAAMETYVDSWAIGGGNVMWGICVRRPTASNLPNVLFNDGTQFNGGTSESRTSKTLTIEPITAALVDDEESVGSFGTQASSYTLAYGNTGFCSLGNNGATLGGVALVRPFNASEKQYYVPVDLTGFIDGDWLSGDSSNCPDTKFVNCTTLGNEWGGGNSSSCGQQFYIKQTKAEWIASGYKTPIIYFDSPITVTKGDMITIDWGDYGAFDYPDRGMNTLSCFFSWGETSSTDYVTSAIVNVKFFDNEQLDVPIGTTRAKSNNIATVNTAGLCKRAIASSTITGIYFSMDLSGSSSLWSAMPSSALFSFSIPFSTRISSFSVRSTPIKTTCCYSWTSLWDCLAESWGEITYDDYSFHETVTEEWEIDQATGTATYLSATNEAPEQAPTIHPTCYYTWESTYDCETATWGTPAILSTAFTGTVSTEWTIIEETGKATYVTNAKTAPDVPTDEFTCYYNWRAAYDCSTSEWTITLESFALTGTVSAWELDPMAYPPSYTCVTDTADEPTPPDAPVCYYTWDVTYTCANSEGGSFGTVTLVYADQSGFENPWFEMFSDGCNFYYECTTTSATPPSVPSEPSCASCV